MGCFAPGESITHVRSIVTPSPCHKREEETGPLLALSVVRPQLDFYLLGIGPGHSETGVYAGIRIAKETVSMAEFGIYISKNYREYKANSWIKWYPTTV